MSRETSQGPAAGRARPSRDPATRATRRASAVSTPKRSSVLPDVPTTLELGYANSDYTFWNGLFLPAKTPREIVERLHQEAQKAATSAAVREKLGQQGIDPMPITAAEFGALINKEIAENIALVKAAGIKVN